MVKVTPESDKYLSIKKDCAYVAQSFFWLINN